MKVTKLQNLDLELYSEALPNGLSIYVVPMKEAKGIHTTFTTKYGGGIDEFIPLNELKYRKVPHGVAHFLEHKMFEQENGLSPFAFFSERGADANAYTNSFQTTYLFSGSHSFFENLNFLLDYVQKPYFTDENVEKEKGIITQEAKMGLDNPGRRMFEESIKQLLVKDSHRYSTIGTIEEINSITKEDLYRCYNTFYHPSNMFVIVTGNVDAKEVFQIVRENQSKKKFEEPKKIQIKEKKEPFSITKKEVTLNMNVSIPKASYNLKIDLSKLLKEMNKRIIYRYIFLLGYVHFSTHSLLNERLENNEIILGSIGSGITDIRGNYLLLTLDAETRNPKEFFKQVKEEFKDLSVTEEDLTRFKRAVISNYYKASDSIYSMHNSVLDSIIEYGEYFPNKIDEIQSLNLKDFEKVRKAFENYKDGTVIIYPNESK